MSERDILYSHIAQKEAENQVLRERINQLEAENEDFKALAVELYNLKEIILSEAKKSG